MIPLENDHVNKRRFTLKTMQITLLSEISAKIIIRKMNFSMIHWLKGAAEEERNV